MLCATCLAVGLPIKLPQLLVDELLKLKKISQKDIKDFEQISLKENKDFGQVLIDKEIISGKDLLELKSKIYHLPSVDLSKISFSKSVLNEISEDVVKFYKIIPFSKEGSILRVGIINPEDINALEALKFIASDKGLSLDKYVIDFKDFKTIQKNYSTLMSEVGKALESFGAEIQKKEKITRKKIEEISEEGAITKIVASTIKYAVDSRASDIHIEPTEEKVRTRFRIDGVLSIALTLPKNTQLAVITRIKVLSNLKIDETRLAQDGRFSTIINERKIDFRVSTFPTKNGEKVVMRILDPLTSKVELSDLGIRGDQLELLKKAMKKPFGSILVTGPTGSGKSTTLAGMLKVLNEEDVNIVTLEDPVEYFISGVNQSQIHEEIGYTFATGLRHILRQDPDIIMVGEIRDAETASLATQAALTGHVVLSTLHTNEVLGVIPRLMDMGVEKYLIPSTLNLGVAQRLLRKLCPDCKIKTKANSGEENIINKALKSMAPKYHKEFFTEDGYYIYKPNIKNPCKQCGGKAFRGRLGIFELLEMSSGLERVILENLSDIALREEAKKQNMVTMFQDGILKVLKGLVSLEELLEVAQAGDSA